MCIYICMYVCMRACVYPTTYSQAYEQFYTLCKMSIKSLNRVKLHVMCRVLTGSKLTSQGIDQCSSFVYMHCLNYYYWGNDTGLVFMAITQYLDTAVITYQGCCCRSVFICRFDCSCGTIRPFSIYLMILQTLVPYCHISVHTWPTIL